jgi:hypothetical protein
MPGQSTRLAHNEKRRKISMVNQEQLDLLKQGVPEQLSQAWVERDSL